MKATMEKTYFNERTQRLHFEIFENLLNEAKLTQMANELFDMLPKTDEEFEKLGITKKIIEDWGDIYMQATARIREYISNPTTQNINISPPNITEKMNVFGSIFKDYCLLYQLFILLQNENKKREVFEYIYTCYSKMMRNPSDIMKIIRENPTSIIWENNLQFQCTPDISNTKRKVLYQYCFLNDDEYDKYVDIEIQELIIAYFKHNRTPKDLFHTDHRYILDYLVKKGFTESKVAETEQKKDPLSQIVAASYNFDPEVFGDISSDDKARMFRLEQRKLESRKLMYSFRVLYPRKSYTDEKQHIYTMEMYLYDRVLFNTVHKVKNDKLIAPEYWEPETLIAGFKNHILPKGELKKGVYMALYLALKEASWTQFQLLFPKLEDDAQIKYDNTTLAFFMDTIAMLTIEDEIKKNIMDEVIQQSAIKKPQVQTMSQTDKTFLKGLLFVCMWEKTSYRRPVYQDILKDAECNLNKENLTQKIEEMSDSWSGDDFHRLFKEEQIENISEVLQKASKLLKMSESGLDFSKFKLDDNFIYSDDLILTLYNFSRIERESIPNLMNIMNLLRERQTKILPIYINPNKKKLNKDNHEKLKKIDIGFTIPKFKRTFAPLQEMHTLRDGEWDGRHIITPITVKFICETDRVHIGKENGKENDDINYIKSNKKALKSVYLYKIRNQATHFSNDETIGNLLKPKNIRQLFIILLEANKLYKDWNNKGTENRPLRVIAPLHAMRRIQKLIQTLAILLVTLKKDDLSIAVQKKLQFMLDENPEQSLKDLEDYIVEQELGKDGISLDKDTYEDILSEKQMKEFEDNIFKIYKISPKEDFCKMSLEEKTKMQKRIQTYALDWAPMKEPIIKTITQVLNFIFASNNADYSQRTQYDEFLKMYYGENAFYLLYLLQHFGDGFSASTDSDNQCN